MSWAVAWADTGAMAPFLGELPGRQIIIRVLPAAGLPPLDLESASKYLIDSALLAVQKCLKWV